MMEKEKNRTKYIIENNKAKHKMKFTSAPYNTGCTQVVTPHHNEIKIIMHILLYIFEILNKYMKKSLD